MTDARVEVVLAPALLDEEQAGKYVCRSRSWMRNTRFEDVARVENKQPPKGPDYIRQGRTIRYERQALDAWIAQFRDGTPPGWSDDD